MASVAVVGLGTMGARMARRLLDAGHELHVWNRDPAKAGPLSDLGASAARTPAEAASRAEAVVTMVADAEALRAVTEGANGVAAGARAGATVVQMSTVGIEPVSRLASVLPDGVERLDAPVLGSVGEAEGGTLRIFAGGPAAVVERLTPLLSPLGSILHVGPLGSGSAAKLVANSTLFGVLGVLGEALALARALGLSQEAAFEVLSLTPVAAQAERRRPAVETGDYPTRFSLSLARKDADLVLDAGRTSGAEPRLAAAVQAWLADAQEAGWGDHDYSALLAYVGGGRAP